MKKCFVFLLALSLFVILYLIVENYPFNRCYFDFRCAYLPAFACFFVSCLGVRFFSGKASDYCFILCVYFIIFLLLIFLSQVFNLKLSEQEWIRKGKPEWGVFGV